MTAQQEYQEFLNSQLTEDYQNWLKTATAEQVNEENAKYTRLKLAAQFEAKQEAENQTILQSQMIEEQRQQLIAFIQSKGYKCDGSVQDFEKLMSKPEIFGSNYKELAKQNSESGGIELFIKLFQNYEANE